MLDCDDAMNGMVAHGCMNSIIYDARLRRRDEWDDGRGWCRLIMYVGMGVGGVESGGSGSIGVGGWRDGWMSGLESMEINLLLW